MLDRDGLQRQSGQSAHLLCNDKSFAITVNIQFSSNCLIGNIPNMAPPSSQGPPPMSNQPPSPGHYNAPPPTSQVGYPTNAPPPISGYNVSNTPGVPNSYPPPTQPGQPNQQHTGMKFYLRPKWQPAATFFSVLRFSGSHLCFIHLISFPQSHHHRLQRGQRTVLMLLPRNTR